jgi:hypothetical protein
VAPTANRWFHHTAALPVPVGPDVWRQPFTHSSNSLNPSVAADRCMLRPSFLGLIFARTTPCFLHSYPGHQLSIPSTTRPACSAPVSYLEMSVWEQMLISRGPTDSQHDSPKVSPSSTLARFGKQSLRLLFYPSKRPAYRPSHDMTNLTRQNATCSGLCPLLIARIEAFTASRCPFDHGASSR